MHYTEHTQVIRPTNECTSNECASNECTSKCTSWTEAPGPGRLANKQIYAHKHDSLWRLAIPKNRLSRWSPDLRSSDSEVFRGVSGGLQKYSGVFRSLQEHWEVFRSRSKIELPTAVQPFIENLNLRSPMSPELFIEFSIELSGWAIGSSSPSSSSLSSPLSSSLSSLSSSLLSSWILSNSKIEPSDWSLSSSWLSPRLGSPIDSQLSTRWALSMPRALGAKSINDQLNSAVNERPGHTSGGWSYTREWLVNDLRMTF